ncbi:NPCBM/NEW2 domain-containing protein [Fontivita pretiosa]|uniref:NPCBM/NEW2 domain-containing protein n=1 Tax=Fontivita pretiosa TaxID=2989684 RepID=UPI003D17DB9E
MSNLERRKSNGSSRLNRALVVAVCALLLLSSRISRADEAWILTTADFRSERVTLSGINGQGAIVDQSRKVGFDRLLMLQRADPPGKEPSQGRASPRPEPAETRFIVALHDQSRAVGRPRAIAGENLVWDNPTLGELTLPLKSVASIVRDGREDQLDAAMNGPAGNGDVLTLNNGDIVRGIVTAITASSVSVQQSDGETIEAPLESVARVRFASIGVATTDGSMTPWFRVGLADGSVINAATLSLSQQQLRLVLPGSGMASGVHRELPLSAVVSIEQINGPVTWLSDLRPVESVQTSMFDLTWPPRMNRAVDGGPIRFNDRTFARGIGVHAYSRLVYQIDPAWRAFRTQYAFASGDLPWANVTVRIRIDQSIAHERADFRAGVLSPPIVLDIPPGARRLTLEVDFGRNHDVQDRFNWIEPAFLKARASPAPSTTPTPATQRAAEGAEASN